MGISWEYLGNIEGVCRRTVPYIRQLPSDDVGNSRTRLFLLRQQTFYIVRLITFAAALFFFFFFITNLWNLIMGDVVMEALLGIDHLSLKAACLGRRFARPVEETRFNLDNCGRL